MCIRDRYITVCFVLLQWIRMPCTTQQQKGLNVQAVLVVLRVAVLQHLGNAGEKESAVRCCNAVAIYVQHIRNVNRARRRRHSIGICSNIRTLKSDNV